MIIETEPRIDAFAELCEAFDAAAKRGKPNEVTISRCVAGTLMLTIRNLCRQLAEAKEPPPYGQRPAIN